MSAPQIQYPPTSGGGTPVGGTGAPNTLPIWSGSTTLSDSAISQVEGCIANVTITNAGTGGTNASYRAQPLTTITGSGTGATADVYVGTTGGVTVIAVRSPGAGYSVGDTLSVSVAGLTGAVFTVTAITQSNSASGNIVGQRVFAGTANSTSGLSTSQGVYSGRPAWQVITSASTGNLIQVRANAVVSSDDEPTGYVKMSPADAATATGIYSAARWDDSLRSTSTTTSALVAISGLFYQPSAGTAFNYGANILGQMAGPNLNGATVTLVGTLSQAIVGSSVTNSNTLTTQYAYDANVVCSATAAHTISNAGYFVPRPGSYNGAAHTISAWYGVWIPAPTLNAGSTIANRFGISQDDVNGRNALRAKVFVGPAQTAAQQTAASLELEATNTILSGTITNAGAGYTNGTYTNQTLTGGAPTVAARANIVVSGGVVTSVTLIVGGEGYAVGNVLSCAIPGGAGFQWTVSTIQGNGDVRLRSNSAVFDASNSSTNGLKLFSRGATGQTSSTLNWYEEGSYTPTFSAAWTPGSYTATWTRIGRKVFVTINFASGTTNGTTGAATITVPTGLTPARAGLGLRGRTDGTASGNGIVAADTAGLIQISTAITLDTNAKTIQVEYEV